MKQPWYDNTISQDIRCMSLTETCFDDVKKKEDVDHLVTRKFWRDLTDRHEYHTEGRIEGRTNRSVVDIKTSVEWMQKHRNTAFSLVLTAALRQ